MRIMMKVLFPAEAANAKFKNGTFNQTLKSILDEIKPEAVYCLADSGMRAAYIFLNLKEPSQIPAVAEPFFLAFNAKIEATPAMSLEDLMKAGPDIEKAVKKYA